MRKSLCLFLLASLLTVPVLSQGSVTPLQLDGSGVQVEGDISAGQKIPLEWAERGAVACFPATRFEQFDGNHVFYRVPMPPGSRLSITLTPKSGAKVNLYALRQSASGEQPVPPNVNSAISAEASYPVYARKVGGKIVQNPDDGIRKIEFISIDQPYSILIGVAGAKGTQDGAYSLQVKVASR